MNGAPKQEAKALLVSVNDGVSRLRSFLRTLALVMITIALTVFTLQNLAPLEVRFITWTARAPSAVIIVVIFVLGAAFGFMAHALRPGRRAPRPKPSPQTAPAPPPASPPLELPPPGL